MGVFENATRVSLANGFSGPNEFPDKEGESVAFFTPLDARGDQRRNDFPRNFYPTTISDLLAFLATLRITLRKSAVVLTRKSSVHQCSFWRESLWLPYGLRPVAKTPHVGFLGRPGAPARAAAISPSSFRQQKRPP